jgi:uncharacterized protein YceK
VSQHNSDSNDNSVYSGTKQDYHMLTQDYRPVPVTVRIVGAVDLPFSAIVDTVLLPYDFYSTKKYAPSVAPSEDATITRDYRAEGMARAYLQPQLHMGDTTNYMIAKFGKPDRQYETGLHETALVFKFPESNHDAFASGVAGFTGFFTNSQLAHWVPIYSH